LEEGIHTYDIFKPNTSKQKVGTKEFAQAIVDRLGQKPQTLAAVHYTSPKLIKRPSRKNAPHSQAKELVGIDVFVQSNAEVSALHKKLKHIENDELKLTMISNRGVRVWPEMMPETACGDTWRCRLMTSQKGKPLSLKQIASLTQRLAEAGIDFTQTEHLYTFDGVPGYTVAQDEQ
jgi:isocitrate dehydrogenase